MASEIKVDNIKDQCGTAVITKCGATHTVTAEVYKADTIQDTSGNAYISKCGSTVTIGGCGQTLSLAAGTTNELGGGGVDWDTTPKTADFTAEAGKGYFVDTTSNTVTVTLPTGVAGESVTILDYVSNANTNEIFFNPQSGEKIEGGTGGQAVNANRQATTLTYSGATQGWLVSSSGDSGPITAPVITFDTASGSLGTLNDTTRTDPNGNLSPITATTTFGTLNYAIQSGSLPSGLTINSSTGAFVGSANSVGSETESSFTVRATVNETGTFSDRSFSITVEPTLFVTATGGTETTSGDYKIHTFNGPGTFTVSCAGNPGGSNSVDYMVVAGGGGSQTSGPGGKGGGGGAGGFRTSSGAASGCYSTSPLGSGVSALPVSVTSYPITVGGGGGGSPQILGTASPGGSSTFSSITSAGGGAAGGNETSGNGTNGTPGGSGGGGGGGGATNGGGGSGNSPPVSPPQGNPGGASTPNGPSQEGGGGGGAGGSGGTNELGPGTSSSITGSSITYSEGGYGFSNDQPSPKAPGPANSGDGGSGTRGQNTPSAPGGSGIVVIRYKYQ